MTLLPGRPFQFHSVNGGSGSDTLDLSGMSNPVHVNLTAGTATGLDCGLVFLSSIESVTGGSGGDRIIGSAAANVIEGGAGNDTVTGRGGADTFVFGAGDGRDTIADFAEGVGAGDVLKLSLGSAFDSFAEVMAVAVQSGANTIIAFDAATRITLSGVLKTALAEDDFAFF